MINNEGRFTLPKKVGLAIHVDGETLETLKRIQSALPHYHDYASILKGAAARLETFLLMERTFTKEKADAALRILLGGEPEGVEQ